MKKVLFKAVKFIKNFTGIMWIYVIPVNFHLLKICEYRKASAGMLIGILCFLIEELIVTAYQLKEGDDEQEKKDT